MNSGKSMLFATLAMFCAGAGAFANNGSQLPASLSAESNFERSESKLIVNSAVDVSSLQKMKSNREVWFTPVLVSDITSDSLALPEFCIAGHNRYIILQRKAHTPADVQALYRSKNVSSIPVHAVLDFQPWMEQAHMVYRAMECGCCDEPVALADIPAGILDFVPRVYEAEWAYITPPAEVKTRALSGSAYIDFPVNRTELYPDYRRNPEELASIRATIDKVRNDSDIKIDSLSIVGYASPEGSYSNNVRLASGRTSTLIEYVRDLYSFPMDILRKNSVPEDWGGLIKRLEYLDIPNRDAILAIARDTTIAPDPRNTKIQREFPAQYKWLLQNVYPALRHSDYTVYYTVVDYTDPVVIGQVLRSDPGKLSLGEMFTYANTLNPDSDEFRDVFEIAVRLYPESEIANINAANTALRRKDFDSADRYLSKAGNSSDAVYLRGVAQAMRQNYTTALPFFKDAASKGFKPAADAIKQLEDKGLLKIN